MYDTTKATYYKRTRCPPTNPQNRPRCLQSRTGHAANSGWVVTSNACGVRCANSWHLGKHPTHAQIRLYTDKLAQHTHTPATERTSKERSACRLHKSSHPR